MLGGPSDRRDAFVSGAWRLESRLLEIVKEHDRLASQGGTDPGWLLPFRQTLRESASGRYRAELDFLLREGDPRLRALIAWMIGRCGNRRWLMSLESRLDDEDPRVRKQIARALRRLEGHSQLREMEARWPEDPWVARFGREHPNAEFDQRLLRFVTGSVTGRPTAEARKRSSMPLWLRDTDWFPTPPKSAHYIRRILLRIRRWVRGTNGQHSNG